MKSRLIKLAAILTLIIMLTPSVSYADLLNGNPKYPKACDGLTADQIKQSSVCSTATPTSDPVVHVIHVATNIIATLAGVVAVIMIIISGISMITSSGKQEAVANARKRLISALIGLIVVALAWTITRFVVDTVLQ